MKKIPIGRDSFKDIIEKDFYYVDKTKIIEEILDAGAYVSLFSRPRRFGKSLMISTIDEFFNVEKKKKTKTLSSKKSKVKFSKLRKNKKYYVRIRTYIKVSGKKVYSTWSGVKSKKTK